MHPAKNGGITDQDAPNAQFEPDLLQKGLSSSDWTYIESQLKNLWPDITNEMIEGYSFSRGDLSLRETSQDDGEGCSYYILQGANRAFAYIFCD